MNAKGPPKNSDISSNSLLTVVAGDSVTRWLAGEFLMTLTVEKVTSKRIMCKGGWEFDRVTGAEIDDELGWGNAGTGSFITVGRKIGADAQSIHVLFRKAQAMDEKSNDRILRITFSLSDGDAERLCCRVVEKTREALKVELAGIAKPMIPPTDNRLQFSRLEAAKRLGYSVLTIDRLVKRGLLHPNRATRRLMFSLRELERFVAEYS